MHKPFRHIGSTLLLATLLSPAVFFGCAARVSGYRVYDVDHGDYHVWNDNEAVFYGRWENETHRDHKDFRQRGDDEKKEYWNWRHQHSDDDHH